MPNLRLRSLPAFLLASLALAVGCEREPPSEMVEEMEALRTERETLRSDLSEVQTTLRDIRRELQEVEIPEDAIDRPLRSAPDSLRAIIQMSAERVAGTQNELRRLRGQASALERRADSLRAVAEEAVSEHEARLAEERRRASDLEEEVGALTATGEGLQGEVDRLTQAVEALESEVNRVYYVAGTRRELLDRGILEEEGGARVLLVLWKRGEALVPARGLDPAEFTAVDRRTAQEIPLPREDVHYRVVSRQDLDYVEVEARGGESLRGSEIRITDPDAFWRSSRFLILVEDR